ncbi:MAG: hypothetical protein H0V82_01575 [Candidatus Protochlamydia sp.]|nr:hypothetical protein [Candidatus Protochlamydia sp.]
MSNEYLRTFFEIEIDFIADADTQQKSWGNAHGEKFGVFMMILYNSWSVIKENQKKYNLSDLQFNKIQKLFNMLDSFEANLENYPTTPSGYWNLLINPEWKKIQRYALEIQGQIYPTLK